VLALDRSAADQLLDDGSTRGIVATARARRAARARYIAHPMHAGPRMPAVRARTCYGMNSAWENGADTYSVSCEWSGSAQLQLVRTTEHAFALHRPHNVGVWAGATDEVVTATVSCRYQLNCCVGPNGPVAASSLSSKTVPSFVETTNNSVSAWRAFWEGYGHLPDSFFVLAVEFSVSQMD
jgi:hypothetical protein